MSFLSRLHKIVNATGGALSSLSPLSLSVDLAKAAFNDEDNDGLAKSLFKTGLARKDQFISGYTGAIGEVIGAVPEPVRAVPRFFVREGIQEPIANVSKDMETVWRNVISRPASTAFTAASLASSPGGSGVAGLLDTDNWRMAYKLAETRSPFQALALGAATKDITDDAQVASTIGSRWFPIATGVGDAALRFWIDPTVIAGKSLKAARLATITKPLDSAERVVALLNDPEKLPKFNAGITQLKTENPKSASAVIRDRLFHDHADGAEISAVLDKAKGQEQYLALRAFAGDIKAQQQLISMRSGIAEEVASLTRQAEDLAPIRATNPDAYTVQKEAITTQIDHWDGIDSRLDRATKAFNTLREEPRFRVFSKVPAIGEVRTAITRSDWYQESALAPTLHRIFDIKAQSMITAASPDGDIQLNRLMTSANLPTPRREELRTLFINAADKNVRRNTAIAIENESMNHLLIEAGMTRDELTEALSRISNGRDNSMAALAKRERQAAGHSTSFFEGEDGVMQALDHPTWVTDDDILIPLVDMDRVKMAVSRIGEFRARHPSSNIPGELMEGFYRLWKPAVLIRPAWTVRVVGDEQLRILAQVGAMTHMENLLTGARDYTTDYIAAVKATRARPNASARVSFGVRDSEYRGYPIESAFGTSDDMVKHQKELISSENQFAHAVGDKALLYQRDLRRTAAETFKTIYPDDKLYAEAYDYSVKRIRSNPIGKQILSGKSEDEVVTWLSSTPEGATVLRSNSVKAHNARNWVKAVTEEINRYTNGSDELWASVAGITPKPPRASPNLPSLYHGTPRAITTPSSYEGRSSENLFGPGFYTTENPDVASEYFRKGKRPGDEPIMYSVAHSGTPNILDMEAPLPANLRPTVKDSVLGTLSSIETPADMHAELLTALESGSGAEIYKLFKSNLSYADPPIPRGEVDDILFDLNQNFLDQGIDVFRYQGGARTGKTNHNAYVFLKPEDLSVKGMPKIDFAALSGTPYENLTRLFPDASMRPFVHGEVLAQALGEGHISQTISRITERAFKMFGKTPTDVMSRNRFFDEVYQAEVKRQIDITIDQGGKLNEAALSSISARARSYADQQVKFHLYDLAESSQLGEMAKFLSPFYNAWREVLTRWVGLAIQNPPFIARMNMAWSAPDKAGLVTDEDGNQVLWGQEYSDAKGDPNYRGKDRYITLPLPEWLHSIPGLSGLAHKGSVAFNKKSFSMLMALPGFGPPAQLLVNEIVKDRPDLADSVKFILPIGPSQNRRDLFIPAGMKRAISLGTEDQNYLNDKIRILMDKVTDISLGKRDFDLSDPNAGKKLYKEATDEANAYYGLRVVSALTLPAAATYRSPYAMYMEALNQARTRYYSDPSHMALADDEGNSRTPDEWFLDSFGKEYFALTQAVTKTMDGIPASLTAWAARKENRDLVERYAELGLGGLIIGEDSGEFNAQVAAIQKESALRPGSDKKQRESISFEDAYEDPQRRLGWIEYRRFMDKLEAIRISRGLPNLQVAGASDLASMKSFYTDALKAKNPAWADDFNQADKGKWDKKIDALRDISSRPEMQGREDMKGIREYLASRDKMTTILASRKKAGGAATLTASSNADLASTWDVITGALVRKNLAFQETFYRHLENDPLGL